MSKDALKARVNFFFPLMLQGVSGRALCLSKDN